MLQRSVVADVALGVGVGIPPFLGGLAEKRDIEQVGFVGIDERRLLPGDGWRDEGLLYGVGMDAIIDFGKGALEVPLELEPVVLFVLETLELLDEIQLELRAKP